MGTGKSGIVVAAAACVALAASCAATRPADPIVRTSRGAEAALAIAKSHPSLASMLARNVDGFRSDATGFTSAGWRSSERGHFDDLGIRLPKVATDSFEIGISRVERLRLHVRLADASRVDAELDEGRVVYRDAYPSTDVIVVSSAARFEELLLLRSEEAPHAFAWDVTLPQGIAGAKEDGEGGLTFVDGRGDLVLHVPRPLAIDANGVGREANLRWSDGKLAVDLDTANLGFPVLLDPALESAVWEKKTYTTSPSYGNLLTWDAGRSRVSMYAPGSATAVWEWDGTNWAGRGTTGPTPSRSITDYAYDGYHAITYGGFGCWDPPTCTTYSFYNETWMFDSTAPSWAKQTPGGFTPMWPMGYFTMTADSTRKKVLLFGGGVDACSADHLTQPCSSTSSSTNAPYVWEWDGSTSPGTWTQKAPPTNPGYRMYHGTAYDSGRKYLITFGGNGPGGIYTNETWEYDPTAVTWSKRTPAHSPIQRQHPTMGYDSFRARVVLYGGSVCADPPPAGTCSGSIPGNDTWEWDGTDWTQRTSGTNPPLSTGAMAFDPTRKRLVMVMNSQTWEYHTKGASCADGTTCETGNCVDGVCCESPSCPGTCQACNTAASPGVCAPVLGADDPDTCASALNKKTCDGAGACKLVVGQACPAGNGDCANAQCVDGFCCNSACTNSCDVCAASLGATADGTCSAATPGYAGNPTCGAYVCTGQTVCPISCTNDNQCSSGNFCDANGTCQPRKAQGAVCNVAAGADCLKAGCRVCTGTGNGSCVDGYCCDTACSGSCDVCAASLGASANGTCTPAPKGYAGGPLCDPFLCGGGSATCPTTCATQADCVAGAFCESGTCKGQKTNGTVCGQDSACASNHCVDGVCCDTACTGSCEACDVSGAVGTCLPVLGGVHGSTRTACTDGAGDPCKATACDGTTRTTCAAFAGRDVSCRPASCADGVATEPGTCDGKGACEAVSTHPCAPYACDATTCKTTCATDTDCGNGGACSSGKCIIGSSCDGQHTVTDATGAKGDCSPYRCVGTSCLTGCRDVGDCVFPAVCSSAGQCVGAAAATGGDDGSGGSGCASTTGAPRSGAALALFAATLGLVVARRRRRSA